jgi:hypothetical protein
MFTEGQIIFALSFIIIFSIIIFLSYKKDIKFLNKTYKGVIWVLIGFIVFFILLVYLKSLVNV